MALGGGGIGGAIGGLVGTAIAGKGGEGSLRQAFEIFNKLETSNFDMRSLSPPEIRVFAEAFPQVYDAVIKGQPTLPEVSQEGRGAQLWGLSRFETIAREGLPTAQRMAVDEAQRQVAGGSRAIEDQILQDMAQRGRLGGGDEIAARLAGASASQNLAAEQGRNVAEMSLQNMLAGTQGAFGAGGQIRASDEAMSRSRADAMNRFNELASTLGTNAAAANAAARERVMMFNVGTRQRTGEESALARYGTEESNINRQNALRGQKFGQEVTKATGESNALTDIADLQEKRRLQTIMAAQSIGQGAGGAAGGAFGF